MRLERARLPPERVPRASGRRPGPLTHRVRLVLPPKPGRPTRRGGSVRPALLVRPGRPMRRGRPVRPRRPTRRGRPAPPVRPGRPVHSPMPLRRAERATRSQAVLRPPTCIPADLRPPASSLATPVSASRRQAPRPAVLARAASAPAARAPGAQLPGAQLPGAQLPADPGPVAHGCPHLVRRAGHPGRSPRWAWLHPPAPPMLRAARRATPRPARPPPPACLPLPACPPPQACRPPAVPKTWPARAAAGAGLAARAAPADLADQVVPAHRVAGGAAPAARPGRPSRVGVGLVR